MKNHSRIIITSVISAILLCFIIYFTLFSQHGNNNQLDETDILEDTANDLSSTQSNILYKTFTHNNIERIYYLYIPSDLPDNASLVIAMHGYTGNAKDFMLYSTWNDVADEHKFIVCYPQGTNDVYNNQPHWNSRIIYSLTDDVGFLSSLALSIADTYSLNKSRIFATGFSNGGYMSYTLACERPDVFRAVAPVSALMSEYTWYSYNPYNYNADTWLEHPVNTPIPICHIHGVLDELIHIDGTGRDEAVEKIWCGGPSARDGIEFWAGINGCTQKETTSPTEHVEKTIYSNPNNNTQVWYITVDNMYHMYPTIKYDDMDISASEIIWEFFSMYE